MNRQHQHLEANYPSFLLAHSIGRDLGNKERSTPARGNVPALSPGLEEQLAAIHARDLANANNYANAAIKADQIAHAEGRWGPEATYSEQCRRRA